MINLRALVIRVMQLTFPYKVSTYYIFSCDQALSKAVASHRVDIGSVSVWIMLDLWWTK